MKKESKKDIKKKQKNKKKKKVRVDVVNEKVSEKQVLFSDVKMYRIMPFLALLGVILIFLGYGLTISNNHAYKVSQARLTMKEGAAMPLFQGKSKGTLTVGNTIVSKDKKHVAVEIKYDDEAHQKLSAFGNRYKLALVTSTSYPGNEIHLKYGFFGSDGNGVLQISSEKEFKDEAFAVILIDHGQLVTSEELSTGTVTDDSINKSITAQLANGDMDSDDNYSQSNSANTSNKMPPMYYVRINPVSSKHVNYNWNNDERFLVKKLFVDDNLKKIKAQIKQNKANIAKAQITLKEYKQRLQENPNDQVAQSGISDIQSTIETLQQNADLAQKNYDRLVNVSIKKDALGQKQTKFDWYKTKNMGQFQSN